MCDKKLIFLVDQGFNDDNHIGVRKKVRSQIQLFKNNEIDAQILQFKWVEGKPEFDIPLDTNILYFRNIGFSIRIAQKLLEIRKQIPQLRVIMEIPTYPFSGEQKNLTIKEMANSYISKTIWRFCVDRFVVMGMDRNKRKLYGIPVLHATNGVNFNEEEVVSGDVQKNVINMICVSGCYFWHGYDRIIKGLADYYQQGNKDYDINLYVVGEGESLQDYKELAEAAHLLDKHVFLCGKLEGEGLQNIFNKCSLAVECLGLHRKGISICGSLKSREYAAKGLPMITSAELDISHKDSEAYILKLPADDSNIDINQIVSFWNQMYIETDSSKIREKIRSIFSKYCSWEIVFKDVIKYMKE